MPEEDVIFGEPGTGDVPIVPDGDTKITMEQVLSNVSEELRNDPSLSPIKDIEGLVKGYVHGQKMVGRDKIALPGEKATPEEWAEVFTKLGRPDDASKYTIGKPEDLPEGFQYRADQEEAFKKVAHKANLTQNQIKEVWNHLTGVSINDFKNVVSTGKSRIEKEQTDLKNEWGLAYPEKVKLANKALFNLVSEDDRKWLQDNGAMREPRLLKMFSEIGSKLGEDKLTKEGSPGGGALSVTESKRQINEIMADVNGPYRNKKDLRHEEFVKKMEELYKYAYPEEKK
jgi:hypothetical protein